MENAKPTAMVEQLEVARHYKYQPLVMLIGMVTWRRLQHGL